MAKGNSKEIAVKQGNGSDPKDSNASELQAVKEDDRKVSDDDDVKVSDEKEGKKDEKKKNTIVEMVRYKRKGFRTFVLVFIILVSIAASLALGYLFLYKWLPDLWAWGFEPTSWRAILSVFGAIYLVIGPFIPFMIMSNTISAIMELDAEDAEKEFQAGMNELEEKQNNYERILQEKDTEGLIPLITYSRIELEQYHKIGLSQTHRSYRYSILAMWIGFFIISFGIISYLVPFPFINTDLLGGNFQILTITSGIVTEVISALFLWIYRSSMNKLTYFYNRQVFIHNALLAYKMARTMKEPDAAKTTIIEKILEFGFSSIQVQKINAKTPAVTEP